MRHQRLHDLITRQLHIEDRTALIDTLDRKRCTVLVSLTRQWSDMVDKCPFEDAVEKIIFMFHKYLHAFILQQTDDTGTHINHLFIIISQALVDDTLQDLFTYCFIKETQQ